jgi:multiple sugar transport system permease protein
VTQAPARITSLRAFGRGGRQKDGLSFRRRWEFWVLVIPAALLVLAFSIFPLAYSVWVSFHHWEVLSVGHPSAGTSNYANVINDPLFRHSVVKTIEFVAIVLPVQTVLGLAIAMIIESRRWARRILLPIVLLPVLVMPIVVAYIWQQLWESPYGVADQFLGLIVGHPVATDWVSHPSTAFAAIVVTEIWEWTPFMVLVLLAGLLAIPPEIREAAEVDGASWWRTFRYEILPGIAPVLIVAIMIRLLDSANLFSTVFVITSGGPGTSTYSIVYYVWNLFRFGDAGRAAAASLLFLVGLGIVAGFLATRLLRSQTGRAG